MTEPRWCPNRHSEGHSEDYCFSKTLYKPCDLVNQQLPVWTAFSQADEQNELSFLETKPPSFPMNFRRRETCLRHIGLLSLVSHLVFCFLRLCFQPETLHKHQRPSARARETHFWLHVRRFSSLASTWTLKWTSCVQLNSHKRK